MSYYVVFDTYVILSSLITKNPKSPPAQLIDMVPDGVITPVFNQNIVDEYEEVLRRPKFSLSEKSIRGLLRMFFQFGQSVDAAEDDELFLRDSEV